MNLKKKDLKIIFNKKNIKKNINITSSTINSKEVKKGSIFFAIKGKKTDGHFYIKEVLRKKSEMIVVKKILNYQNIIGISLSRYPLP